MTKPFLISVLLFIVVALFGCGPRYFHAEAPACNTNMSVVASGLSDSNDVALFPYKYWYVLDGNPTYKNPSDTLKAVGEEVCVYVE